MKKTLLYRLFGTGRLPQPVRPILEAETILLVDEGIGGTITFRDFRAPRKRYRWRRTWFSGSIAITSERFAAFAFSKPLINVPLSQASERLDCSVERATTLCVVFDPSAFHEQWSGTMECRFSTEQARPFLERLQAGAA